MIWADTYTVHILCIVIIWQQKWIVYAIGFNNFSAWKIWRMYMYML